MHLKIPRSRGDTRQAFQGVEWANAEAVKIAEDTAAEFLVKLRAGKELQPLNLDAQPDIQQLLKVVDVEDLIS